MKARTVAVALAILLATGAQGVFAQNTDTGATGAGGVTTGVSGTALTESMNDIAGRIKSYNSLKGLRQDQVRLVDVRTLGNDFDTAGYEEGLTRNDANIRHLRSAAGSVSVLKGALSGGNVSADHVVAMDVLNDGGVVLYYDSNLPNGGAASGAPGSGAVHQGHTGADNGNDSLPASDGETDANTGSDAGAPVDSESDAGAEPSSGTTGSVPQSGSGTSPR